MAMNRVVVLRAPCGCVRVAAPDPTSAHVMRLRGEAKRRGYTCESHRGPEAELARLLRETWTCGDADCPFQAEVQAEEGRPR